MSDDLLPEAPPTEEERLTASRLAEALESSPRALQEWETSRVVHLMEAARAEGPDELSMRRLRRELVASAGRPSVHRRWRSVAAAVAAAVAVGLLAVYMGRLVGRPGERLLEEREQAARAALSSVAATGSTSLAGAYERRWAYRSDSSLESARYQRLTGIAPATTSRAASSPSPKGGES